MYATIKGLGVRMTGILIQVNSSGCCVDRIIAIRINHVKIHVENDTCCIGK